MVIRGRMFKIVSDLETMRTLVAVGKGKHMPLFRARKKQINSSVCPKSVMCARQCTNPREAGRHVCPPKDGKLIRETKLKYRRKLWKFSTATAKEKTSQPVMLICMCSHVEH